MDETPATADTAVTIRVLDAPIPTATPIERHSHTVSVVLTNRSRGGPRAHTVDLLCRVMNTDTDDQTSLDFMDETLTLMGQSSGMYLTFEAGCQTPFHTGGAAGGEELVELVLAPETETSDGRMSATLITLLTSDGSYRDRRFTSVYPGHELGDLRALCYRQDRAQAAVDLRLAIDTKSEGLDFVPNHEELATFRATLHTFKAPLQRKQNAPDGTFWWSMDLGKRNQSGVDAQDEESAASGGADPDAEEDTSDEEEDDEEEDGEEQSGDDAEGSSTHSDEDRRRRLIPDSTGPIQLATTPLIDPNEPLRTEETPCSFTFYKRTHLSFASVDQVSQAGQQELPVNAY